MRLPPFHERMYAVCVCVCVVVGHIKWRWLIRPNPRTVQPIIGAYGLSDSYRPISIEKQTIPVCNKATGLTYRYISTWDCRYSTACSNVFAYTKTNSCVYEAIPFCEIYRAACNFNGKCCSRGCSCCWGFHCACRQFVLGITWLNSFIPTSAVHL